MSDSVEGAATTPDEPPDPSVPAATDRPARPVLVELGSAILIVGSITALMGLVAQQLFAPDLPADAGLGVGLYLVVVLVSFAIGIVMRAGRWWRLCVNVVAVTIVVYVTRLPNPIAFLYLLLDGIVIYGLMHHRAWFDRPPAVAGPPTRNAA